MIKTKNRDNGLNSGYEEIELLKKNRKLFDRKSIDTKSNNISNNQDNRFILGDIYHWFKSGNGNYIIRDNGIGSFFV